MNQVIFTLLCISLYIPRIFGQAGLDAFQLSTDWQSYTSADDIFKWQASDYTGDPWNLVLSDVSTATFEKSVAFWVRHNRTSAPITDIPLMIGGSEASNSPATPLQGQFVLSLTADSGATTIKLEWYADGTPDVNYELICGMALEPYVWYGVFASRLSDGDSRGYLFVLDPSNGYVSDSQTSTNSPAGFAPTLATDDFFVTFGGNAPDGTPCSCDIGYVNLFYNTFYNDDDATAEEYLKQAPKLLLWLEFREDDNDLETIEDLSDVDNVAFRGSSQYDIDANAALYADETANAERGHVFSQNQYDTIFPAFNLGREFAISFWARFTSAPATVADDSTQYVFYKENSEYSDMQAYVGFIASPTEITDLIFRAGETVTTINLNNAITRDQADWQFFYVYIGNLLKNESVANDVFEPTSTYTYVIYDQTGAYQTGTGTATDVFYDGSTADVMRIGYGATGTDTFFYGVLKKFQIIRGGWLFNGAGLCDYYLATPKLISIDDGELFSEVACLTCSGGNFLQDNSCQAACPSETYTVNDGNFDHCETCYFNCLVCSGRKQTQCTDCDIGSWDPFGEKNCPGAEPCTSHQYFDGIACQECDDNCATCSSADQCSSCVDNLRYNLANNQCETKVCGDGNVVAGEECDDGNNLDGDGCSKTCTIETGWYCPIYGGSCWTVCGDNVRASTEECDDGNNNNNDGCSYDCKIEEGYFCTEPLTAGPFTSAVYRESCVQCDGTDCVLCESASVCSECDSGKFLVTGTGLCENDCSSAAATYADSSTQTCVACPDFCSDCTSSSVCTDCTATNALLDDLCVEVCPDGTYNGVDGAVRRCLDCPETCETCSDSDYCLSCPSDRARVIDGGDATCEPCHSSCETCRGIEETDCVNCPEGSVFQTATSMCVVLDCALNEFADLTIGECVACDASCRSCTDATSTGCKSCPDGYGLTTSGSCWICDQTNDLRLNSLGVCYETCGDGYKTLAITQCDDANTENGDGCDDECRVEEGWSCEGGDETSPDYCVSLSGPALIIETDHKNPEIVILKFDREIINNIKESEIYNEISVELSGINVEDSQYNITYDEEAQEYELEFFLKRSLLDSTLAIQFVTPAKVTDRFGNTLQDLELEVSFPDYYHVTQSQRDTADKFTIFVYVITGVMALCYFPLVFANKAIYFYVFVEFFQIVNYLKFINVRHPYFAEQFYEALDPLQLKWLPDVPDYVDMDYDQNEQIAPGKFDDRNKDTFFLVNAGSQLTTWAIVLVLWFISKSMRWCIKEYEARGTRDFVRAFNSLMEWYIPILFVLITLYDFLFATMLQYYNLRFTTHLERTSSILSLFAALFIVGIVVFTILKTKNLKSNRKYEADNKYDLLHDHFRSEKKVTSMFLLFILAQKIAFALVIVYGQDDAATQISVLAGLELVTFFTYVIVKPYKDFTLNLRAIWQEFTLFVAICALYGVIDRNADDEIRNNAGRVIAALMLLTFVIHGIFIIKEGAKWLKLKLQGKKVRPRRQDIVKQKLLETKLKKLQAQKEALRLERERVEKAKAEAEAKEKGEDGEKAPEEEEKENKDDEGRHRRVDSEQKLDITETNNLLKVEIRPNSALSKGTKKADLDENNLSFGDQTNRGE